MENEKNKEFEEFIKLITSLNNYEKRIESINNSFNSDNDIGYLVDKDEFIEIKNSINYKTNKNYLNPYKEDQLFSEFKISKFENVKKLDAIEINSADYIKNIILNLNCVLITKELFGLVNINTKKQISFIAKKGNLTLILKNNEKLDLSPNNFILDNSSFNKNIPKDSVKNEINLICEQMLKFYEFENKSFQKDTSGYLLKKEWIDEWKNYSNYEYFKKNYLENNKNILNKYSQDYKKLIKEIIDYREKHKNKYKFPSESSIIKANNEKELRNILKNGPLVLVNFSFKSFFSNLKNKYDCTQYKYSNGEITIIFRDKTKLSLLCDDLILAEEKIIGDDQGKQDEQDGKDLNIDLKQLIRIFCFQHSLPDIENKDYYKENIKRENIILINKNKIEKYKNHFNYKELCDKLEKIIKTKRDLLKNGKIIDYSKLTDNIMEQIITDLANKHKYNIQKYNMFSEINNNSYNSFDINYFEYCKYIENFELISQDIADYFLKQKLFNENDIIKGEIIIDNPHIGIFFNYKSQNYYEIGYLNSTKDFNINYLIKEKNIINKSDIINALSHGIQSFLDKEFEHKGEIIIDGKKLGNFYYFNSEENCKKSDNIKEEKNKTPEDNSNNRLYFNNTRFKKDQKLNNINNINSNKDKDYTNIKKYLNYSIILYDEYHKIKDAYFRSTFPGKEADNDYYLINPNYMKEFESIIHYEDLKGKIEKLKSKKNNYSNDKIIEVILNEIKNDKIEDELDKINEKSFKNLNNKNIYELKKINKYLGKSNQIYFENSQIINNEIIHILFEVDKLLDKYSKTYESIYCLFSNKKAIIFLEQKIINVGLIDDDNIFIPNLLIYSKQKNNLDDLSKIYELIRNKGYKYIESFIKDGHFSYDYPNSEFPLTAEVYNLKEVENDKNKVNNPYIKKVIRKTYTSNNISKELKELILLLLSKENHESENLEKLKKPEEVYLVNKKYYEQFNNKNITDFYNKMWDIYKLNANSSLNDIISKLDNSLIEKLEDEIKSGHKKIDLNADSKIMKINSKNIKIYEEFVLINKNNLHFYDKNFKINNNICSYAKLNDSDIIIIKERPQYSILIGNYIKENYSFNIKYVFDYFNENILLDEVNYILSIKKINEYIDNNIVLDKKDDYVSPIFNDKEIIGICYKYKDKKFDYSSYIDYLDILNNEKLISSIVLSFNYQTINEYLINLDEIIEDKFYFINSDSMNQIKEGCNYEKISEFIKNSSMDINIFKDQFNYKFLLLKSIKSIDYNKLKNLLDNDYNSININNEYTTTISDLIAIPVNYIDSNNENKSVMIYNNFEIINEKIIDKLLDSKSIKNINCYSCIFTCGKMIINYPKKIVGNKEFISVIGEFDYMNIFIPKYVLIYNSERDIKSNLAKLKANFDEYLQQFNFENSNSDIIFFNKKNIGVIVKIDSKKPIHTPTPPPPPISGSIRDYFKEAPLIGLQNIGATCYMNATLQCFNHIEKFVNFFKYSPHALEKYNSDSSSLSYSFKLLIDKLWPNNFNPNNKPYTYYAPNDFKTKISKMNSLFEGIAANDAKDLVNFIIMTLHEELNNPDKNNNNVNDYTIDQSDKQKVFQNFMEIFIKNNKSIISDIFYSSNCSITECSNCHIKLYNYQVYFFIVFPLEEVRKFKLERANQNMNNNMNNNMNIMNMNMNNNMNIINNMNMSNNMINNMNNNMNMNFINFMGNNNLMLMNNNFFMPNAMNNMNNMNNMNSMNNMNNINIMNNMNSMNNMNNVQQNNEVDILDCFDYDAKQNVMSGQNAMYCNNCKVTCDSYMSTRLITGPEIFILLLNRGKGKQFDVKINFTEFLDLTNYIEYNQTGAKYKLIGVISHIGGSGMDGHFIAYCRDPLTEKWHKYNDAIVSDVENFEKEVINSYMPYLLFYQKIQ